MSEFAVRIGLRSFFNKMSTNSSSNAKSSLKGRALYDRALIVSHREAVVTLIAAVFTMIYFWAAILIFEKSPETVLHMPLWFMASCVCGYLFSVIAVLWLVKRWFVDIDLDEVADAYRQDEEAQ